MKLKIILLLLVTISLGCENKERKQVSPSAGNVEIAHIETFSTPQDKNFIDKFTDKVEHMLANDQVTDFKYLQDRIIENIEENSEIVIPTATAETTDEMSGNELYFYLKERTYVVGTPYLCTQCPNTHLSAATAFAINDSGIFMTNYHVVELKKGQNPSALFISDSEGNVFNVVDILAASQSNDLAIIKVDTKGEKLKYIPFAKEELLGEDTYLMGHPFGQYYFMSKGIISRKYINDRDNEPRLSVTAEFGQGSSGGPFVNTKGELVAMVAGTYSNFTNNDSKNGYLQMITKEVIPVSTMWKYVKKDVK